MGRKSAMPQDVRAACLACVRGYRRRRLAYMERRAQIMGGSADHVVSVPDRHDPGDADKAIGVVMPRSSSASRTTEDIALRLQKLEQSAETRRMRAVEYARDQIGRDLPHEQREALTAAIFKSCIDGRRWPFERLGVEGMERSCFYDRRAKFLEDIAISLEML